MQLPGAFVATFDPAGAIVWSKHFSNTTATGGSVLDRTVSLSPQGDIVWTPEAPSTNDPIDFGCGPLAMMPDWTTLLVKLGADGHCVFSNWLGVSYLAAIGVDPSDGSIAVGGMAHEAAPSSGYDIALMKFDAAGNVLWRKQFGTSGMEGASAIAVDPATGNLAITGSLVPGGGAIDFGLGALQPPGAVYAAVFTGAGAPVWAARFGDGSPAQGNDLVFAPNGLVIGGGYSGLLTFDGHPLQAAGTTNGFVTDLRLP